MNSKQHGNEAEDQGNQRGTPSTSKFAKPLAWTVGVLITSLLLPAITRQWSDRPKELELKSSLVAGITEMVADVVMHQKLLIFNLLPEARLHSDAAQRLTSASAEQKPERERELAAARSRMIEAEQRMYNDDRETVGRNALILQAKMAAYFPHSDLEAEMQRLHTALDNYIAMGVLGCSEKQAGRVRQLQAYLPKDLTDARYTERWRILESVECGKVAVGYSFAFDEVSPGLVDRGKQLARKIAVANAAGFSTGWGDLLKDTLPF